MSRKISFDPGEYYHVYNRGVDKRSIFLSDFDKRRFLKLMFYCNSTLSVDLLSMPESVQWKDYDRKENIVDIGLYCLMTNHFHMLLHEKTQGGISKFMQKLSTAYTMYFNKKSERTGSLFEGRFKAKHIDSNDYLEYIFSYIHLNPIDIIEKRWKEEGLKDTEKARAFVQNYEYSSYPDYVGNRRKEGLIINKKAFPVYGDIQDFSSCVTDSLMIETIW